VVSTYIAIVITVPYLWSGLAEIDQMFLRRIVNILFFFHSFFVFFSTKSWKSELSRLPFSSYFGKIEDPGEIRFIDFLKASATSTSCKRDLHHSWAYDILPRLSESEAQVLREIGANLTRSWSQDKQAGEATRFWRDMEKNEAKERHLHALHLGVYERETAVTELHTFFLTLAQLFLCSRHVPSSTCLQPKQHRQHPQHQHEQRVRTRDHLSKTAAAARSGLHKSTNTNGSRTVHTTYGPVS